MADLWSPARKVVLERQLWIAVLRAQSELGLPVEPSVIAAHEAVVDRVDLHSIAARERVLRHDVKARIEEFCALAGHEHVHEGMTSRDLTENVEQMQVRAGLALVRDRVVAALARMARLAADHATLVVTGRSHNVPAQATTVGKRVANSGEELLIAYERLTDLLGRYPLRGIKGPVGTQADMLDLLGPDSVAELERRVAAHLGFERVLDDVGQVYPRSLDLDVISALVQVAGGPSSFATTLRLMAGADLATEGFQPGQVGSSAMPHKMNSRSCERINGLKVILSGHLAMAAGLAGDQWNEGDVSCSVVRRVMLPGAFLAVDGMFETFLHVLDELGFYPAVIARELERNLPFLATTRVLMAAVKAGVGRETAHEAIKEHAVAVALDMRERGRVDNDLLARLAADPRLPLDRAALDAIVAEPVSFVGAAPALLWLLLLLWRWWAGTPRPHATRPAPSCSPTAQASSAAASLRPTGSQAGSAWPSSSTTGAMLRVVLAMYRASHGPAASAPSRRTGTPRRSQCPSSRSRVVERRIRPSHGAVHTTPSITATTAHDVPSVNRPSWSTNSTSSTPARLIATIQPIRDRCFTDPSRKAWSTCSPRAHRTGACRRSGSGGVAHTMRRPSPVIVMRTSASPPSFAATASISARRTSSAGTSIRLASPERRRRARLRAGSCPGRASRVSKMLQPWVKPTSVTGTLACDRGTNRPSTMAQPSKAPPRVADP